MPLNAPETVALTSINNGFFLEGPDGDISYELVLTDRGFDIDTPEGYLPVDGAEFELLIGCPVADLPRLLAQRQMVFDGLAADLTVRAVVADTSTIYMWFHMASSVGVIQQASVMGR